MEGNNMNGFNMGNMPGAPGIAPQPMQPQQPPVMPTMEGASGVSPQPVQPNPVPVMQQPAPTPEPVSVQQNPMPTFQTAPAPAEPVVKEFEPSNDVSSITSAIMNDTTKKKSKGGNGFALFLLIIVIMETIYIGYDFCMNHMDLLNGENKVPVVQDDNNLNEDENKDEELVNSQFGDIENYVRPDNALEEYKFNLSINGNVEEVTLRIDEDKKLSYAIPATNTIKTFDNISNARYFVYTTLSNNNLSELYVNTSDYKAYKIVFEDATEKKYEKEDFFASAVEIITENNDICNIIIDKANIISSAYEPTYSYNVGATLTDSFTYEITDNNVTKNIFVKSNIKDSLSELDGISLTLDADGKVNFYSKDGKLMSKLIDENSSDIVAKDAIAVPIKDGESYRYKYYILTSDDLLCFVFNNDIKSGMDTQAKYYSTKVTKDYTLVEDTTYVNDNYKKYNQVTMRFLMATEPEEKYEDLKLSPIGMAAGDERNLIYVLGSKKIK